MQSRGWVHSSPLRSISCSDIDPRPDDNQTGPNPDLREKLEFQTPNLTGPGSCLGHIGSTLIHEDLLSEIYVPIFPVLLNSAPFLFEQFVLFLHVKYIWIGCCMKRG